MSIWDLCIRRPVFTVMLVSAPIVLGIIAYSRLGVDLLPHVEMPIVIVTTTLKGASVEEMETSVTKPLEEIINTVSGIDELRSTTKEGDLEDRRPVRAGEEPRRGGPGSPRQDLHDPLPAPRGHRPADHRQARPQRHAGHADRRLRPAADAGNHRDRPQADQGGPGGHAGRGGRDPGGRAAAGGQRLRRHRQADRLRPVDRGRAPGPDAAEPGTSRRPRRPGGPGAGAAHHGPHGDHRRLQRADRRQPERPSRCGSRTSAAWRIPSRSPAGWPGWTARTPSA